MLVTSKGRVEGSIGGGEVEQIVIEHGLKAIHNSQPAQLTYQYLGKDGSGSLTVVGEVEVFLEPILPKHTIVVVGAGHVGQQVVTLSKWLGYQVILSDDRIELCTPASCPGADQYVPCPLETLPEHIEIRETTCFVLATRNADVDIKGLPSLLGTQAAYIGVIGSDLRKNALLAGLKAAGVTEEQMAKIHSPIGLKLDAETPQEIALSILSEILLISAESKQAEG